MKDQALYRDLQRCYTDLLAKKSDSLSVIENRHARVVLTPPANQPPPCALLHWTTHASNVLARDGEPAAKKPAPPPSANTTPQPPKTEAPPPPPPEKKEVAAPKPAAAPTSLLKSTPGGKQSGIASMFAKKPTQVKQEQVKQESKVGMPSDFGPDLCLPPVP